MMLKIALSSDARGHAYSATLLASILRRTAQPVWVRYWCRGFLPESFTSGPLRVEFIRTEEAVTGRYPGHVNQAVFDRLRVIRDGTDWDRCLIMDHDDYFSRERYMLREPELKSHFTLVKEFRNTPQAMAVFRRR